LKLTPPFTLCGEGEVTSPVGPEDATGVEFGFVHPVKRGACLTGADPPAGDSTGRGLFNFRRKKGDAHEYINN